MAQINITTNPFLRWGSLVDPKPSVLNHAIRNSANARLIAQAKGLIDQSPSGVSREGMERINALPSETAPSELEAFVNGIRRFIRGDQRDSRLKLGEESLQLRKEEGGLILFGNGGRQLKTSEVEELLRGGFIAVGEDVEMALIGGLESEEKELKEACAEVLEGIGNKRVVERFMEDLDNEDSNVRNRAAIALGKIGSEIAVEPLIQALRDQDDNVLANAARALGNIGSEAAVKALIQALQDQNRDAGESAVEALGNIGGKAAVEALIQALRDRHSNVRTSAAQALIQIGDDKIDKRYLKLLNDKNPDIRLCVVKILGQLSNEEAIFHLFNALSDEDIGVKIEASRGLANFGITRQEDSVEINIMESLRTYWVKRTETLYQILLDSRRAVQTWKEASEEKLFEI